MSVTKSLAALVVVAFAYGDPLVAQQEVSDTLPFRKGQWAVEFPIQSSIGIGFLRFGSRNTAIQVDARFVAAKTQNDTDGEPSYGNYVSTEQSIDLRVGRRVYRPLASKAAMLVSAGVAPGWYRGTYVERRDTSNYESEGAGWKAGVFAEIGGIYFVTPKLSVGMLTGARGYYSLGKSRSSSPGFGERRSTRREYELTLLSATITGAVYF